MGSSGHNFLAIDLGASNGRVILGRLQEGRLGLETVQRFEHFPRMYQGRLCWDWPFIRASVREGLARAAEQTSGEGIVSVSCDSWAQDFGLLDAEGRLILPPVSYRDTRTEGMPHSFADVITPDELVRRTGSVVSPLTTLCQLRAMALREPDVLSSAATLLHIANLMAHDLCGSKATDRTMSTASQLRNLQSGRWDRELLNALSIPDHFLPDVAETPTVIGEIPADRAPHPDLANIPVVSTAGHDTAAAAELVPSVEEGVAVLSCGTWSMVGCASDCLLMPTFPERDGLFVIGLAHGRWALFRAIMGLWLIQECRRAWAAEGAAMSFEQLAAAAESCASHPQALIDPDDARFVALANMPHEISQFCAETGQSVPASPGQIARTILVSLALDYRMALETLERAANARFGVLRVVGGGSANECACRLTADITGLPVIAGPVEATAVGNILLQASTMHLLDSTDVVPVADASFPLRHYDPAGRPDEELYRRFQRLKRRGSP